MSRTRALGPVGYASEVGAGEGTNAASTTPASDKLRAKGTKWTPLKGVVVSRRNGKDWEAPTRSESKSRLRERRVERSERINRHVWTPNERSKGSALLNEPPYTRWIGPADVYTDARGT